MKLFFRLPYPPSVNQLYATVYGRRVLSKAGRSYKKHVTYLIGWKDEPLEDYLEVDIKVWPPDKRRRDIDNVAKILLDSLTDCGLWKDDSQIKRLVIEMMLDVKEGGEVLVGVGKRY